MNRVYSDALEQKLTKKLRLYRNGAAATLITGLMALPAGWAAGPVPLPVAAALAVATALAWAGAYMALQRKILPLSRAHRRMKELQGKKPEPFEGIFRGMAPARVLRDGILMYSLRLDEGKLVGKEPVFRELNIPAVFEAPDLAEGTFLRGESVGSILLGLDAPLSRELNAAGGRYRVSPLAVLGIAAVSALLWGSIWTAGSRSLTPQPLVAAVCAPAHHAQTEQDLRQELEQAQLRLTFSYTNTLEPETVATYLATFASLDADLWILNETHFASVFENDALALDEASVARQLGFAPRFLYGPQGNATGVLLYVPGDDDYNARFPVLTRWIAVEKDTALVAAVHPESPNDGTGAADLALVQLLVFLSGK